MTVAVFGGNDAAPGDRVWEDAVDVGRRLARANVAVLTGGYGGVMEAASRGARDEGGAAQGVLCAMFEREPNGFLSESTIAPDLWRRTRELIERADGYLVLPGKSGTLAELTFVWALRRAGCLGARPVVLLGESWRPVMDALDRAAMLDENERPLTLLATTPEEAVELLCRRLKSGNAAE